MDAMPQLLDRAVSNRLIVEIECVVHQGSEPQYLLESAARIAQTVLTGSVTLNKLSIAELYLENLFYVQMVC